jgi:hypothetical protein
VGGGLSVSSSHASCGVVWWWFCCGGLMGVVVICLVCGPVLR